MSPASSNALGREQIRQLNQSVVLNAIHRHGRISRSDLAVELRLSPAAVSAITASFVDSGLVVEAETAVSTSVGRKPILLEIDYDHAFVFGVKVTSTSLVTALTNLQAEPVECRTEPLERLDADSVLEAITTAAEGLLEASGLTEDRIAGMGVSLPGIVEQGTGQVRYSPLLNWYGVPFAQRLEEKLGKPVLLENDVNALAAAEAWFGHGQHHGDFLVITLGRGVGMGLVIGGELYRGPRGGAGELGHTTAVPLQPRVMSPAPRTLEEFLSDRALVEQAQSAGANLVINAAPERLTQLAKEGDATVLALFEDAGSLLGTTIANLVNIFAPSLVVISGEGVRNAPFFMPSTRAALARYAFGDVAEGLELVVDDWGDDAWARGAAGLAAARFLAEAAVPADSRPGTTRTKPTHTAAAKGG